MTQFVERPPLPDARRVTERGLDPAAAGQRDDDQVQEAPQRVAEVTAAGLGFGVDAEVGEHEAGQTANQRTPQRQRQWKGGTVQRQQADGGRNEEEPDDGKGDLLGQVALRAAAEYCQVASHPRPHQGPTSGPGEHFGEGMAQPRGEPAWTLGGEHGWRIWRAAQLGERLCQGWSRRSDSPGDEEQAGTDSGTAEHGGDHRLASGAAAAARNRAGSAGLVILAIQANAAANSPPTKSRTSWPTPLP